MRKFLVVLDDTRECLNAMRFAAMRAANTQGGVEILSVIPPDEFNHWIGVGEVMRAEARERIEAHFNVFAKWMRDRQGVDPRWLSVKGSRSTRSSPMSETPRRSGSSSSAQAPARAGRARWSRR
jgi:hypothetical protein